MAIYTTACPRNCYSTCTFRVEVEDGKIKKILPHTGNRATPEGVCLKGLAYVERANSPNRIRFPLRKNPKTGEFEKISWSEALSLIAEKLHRLKSEHGAHSILFYAASGMSGMVNGFSQKFWQLFGGCSTVYGNLCWPAGLEATRLTLGENKHNAPWDMENARLIVMWGKNPAETNVQETIFLQKALAKGAKYVLIDPRRTPSAQDADLHIQPRPGTDAAIALAVANILIQKGWTDRQFIEKYVLGFDEFATAAKSYTPAYAARIAKVSESEIEHLAQIIGQTAPMTLTPGYGMQRFTNGGQTIRAILALSVITGNIGKKGACWHYANLQSYVFDSLKEPESYYPREKPDSVFRRRISTARLGKDIFNAKEPPIKMIWVERGNPISQNPDTNSVLEAFRSLDYRVVVEQFMTDTAREADIVLPAKNMFEQSDIIGSYWNPYVQFKPKVVEASGAVRPETEIYYHLALRLGYDESIVQQFLPPPGDQNIVEFLETKLADFPDLDLKTLKENPQIAPAHEEIAFPDLQFPTPSGKIELLSQQARELWNVPELPTYVPLFERPEADAKHKLYLLSPNTKNRIHSQFNNLKVIKQFHPEPVVSIHPNDAKARKIKHGDLVKVFNDRGSFRLKAEFDLSLKPGCVAISNGWWISQGGSTNALSAARETDMGYGAAFHDNLVEIQPAKKR